jgi:prepilin-type N-terminal cleavage/methylation domain-containing protein
MKKSAFTMMEVIFVIIVIGILSAVFIPKFGSNNLSRAANQVISHIRYTQHLALMDDKYDSNNQYWYKKRWEIIFGSSAYTENKIAYTIFSDTSKTGEPDISEMARNPLNSTKVLSGGYSGTLATSNSIATAELNIGKKYGITSYTLTGGCSGARISFDYFGRPLKGDLSTMTGPYTAGTQRLITRQCVITLNTSSENVRIAIEPETGYVHLL